VIRTTRARLLAVAVAVAAGTATLAACGTRVSEAERERYRAAVRPGAGPASPATTAPARTAAPSDYPCGPGDAKGATDVGVTDESITIYTVQDISGPQPGLFKPSQDAMQGFVDHCNSLGGVNGRKLELVKKDSSFFEPRPPVEEACDKGFALVGSAIVFDDQIVDVTAGCDLPVLPTMSTTSKHSNADNVIHAVPNPLTQWQAGPAYWFAEHHPKAVKRAATLYADLPQTKNRALQQKSGYEQAGFRFVMRNSTPLNQLNWGPTVDELRSKKIGYVTVWSGLEDPANLMKEIKAQGVDIPIVDIQAQSYDPHFLAQAGPAAEGAYVGVSVHPLEEADSNRETATFIEWTEKADGQPTALGAFTWSSGLLFAQAVKHLGSKVTRAGLLEYLRGVHKWDGEGIHAVGDPGANRLTQCYVLLQVRGGKFTRVFPEKGFECDPRFAAKVPNPEAQS